MKHFFFFARVFALAIASIASGDAQTAQPLPARARPFIASNGNQIFAVNANGSAYIWGYPTVRNGSQKTFDGRLLGLDPAKARSYMGASAIYDPAPLVGLPGRVAALEAYGEYGQLTFMAVLEDGSIWVLGRDLDARLGLGYDPDAAAWKKQPLLSVDRPTPIPGVHNAIDVRLGNTHALALLRDGRVLAWGRADTGVSGADPERSPVVVSPTPVTALRGALAIAAGSEHSLALLHDGSVVAWGNNRFGQLGDGSYERRLVPVEVKGIRNAIAITARGNASFALLADGSVVGWGSNGAKGELAQPRPDYEGDTHGLIKTNLPIPIRNLPKIRALVTDTHTLAIAMDGSVWSWGEDNYGQLGTGQSGTTDLAPAAGPYRVKNLANPVAVSAFGNSSTAIMPDGSIKFWGALPYKHPVLRNLGRQDSSLSPIVLAKIPLHSD